MRQARPSPCYFYSWTPGERLAETDYHCEWQLDQIPAAVKRPVARVCGIVLYTNQSSVLELAAVLCRSRWQGSFGGATCLLHRMLCASGAATCWYWQWF